MKTTLTRENASTVRLHIEATADEVAPALDRAVKALGSEIKVPGFRKGHVPRKILENRLGPEAVRDATIREALPELLTKALSEDDSLIPVAAPRVEQTEYEVGGDLTLQAIVDVRPEIELPDFSQLTATRPSTAATEQEIDDQLGRLQDRFASLEAVERPAREGDFIACDIQTTYEDQEMPELTGKDQLYEVGTAWPVPTFDTELTGKRAGDIVRFDGTLPDDMGEHGGKRVTFQVLVKEVRQKVTPALDDEFAKTASEYDTLSELRSDLEERITEVKSAQADGALRDQVLEQLLDEVEFEAPESLVVNEMAFRLQRFEERLQQAGMTLDDYMQSQDVTEEKLEADLRSQAERNVRAQLILEEIGRREEFKVSEDELREEVRSHAAMMRADPAELEKQLSDRSRLLALAGDIIRRKALNLLVERADIKEEDATAGGDAPASEETTDA